MSEVTADLKALRLRAEPKLSVRKMADALDVPASTYAAYEDPAKYKKPILPLQLTKRIADVLAERGVSRGDVLRLAGVTGDLSSLLTNPQASEEEEYLRVTGAVAAGVWKAQTEWPGAEQYLVRFGPSGFPKEQRFAVRMEGLSMNRTIQPGADLECLWIKFSPIPPRPGDLVIVERTAHDLVEMTCKRLDIHDGQYVLRCESYEPEFQDVIMLGAPDHEDFSDNECRVIGIVLSAKLDLAPKGLSQRRYPQS